MGKIEAVLNELKNTKYDSFIVFYMMGKYGFIIDKDVDRLKSCLERDHSFNNCIELILNSAIFL